jgi:ankyrin repeat protein
VALKDLRRAQRLKKCVERGNPDDLEQIKLEIDQDPYKKIRLTSHPLALINKRDTNGQTPLYIACKNGNLEVVMLLLKEKADYLLTSQVEDEQETNLEVAVRWGHKRIVQELLKLKWSKIDLAKAKHLCRADDMCKFFKKSSRKKSCFCFSIRIKEKN